MRAIAAAGLLLTGCFYVDPIVDRPVVEIFVVDPDVIYRGGSVTLQADFVDPVTGDIDPDAGLGTYDWQVYACTGYSSQLRATGCDGVAFYDSPDAELKNTVEFSVPVMIGQAPTQAIRARLVARSDRGAVAQGLKDVPVAEGPSAPILHTRRGAKWPALRSTWSRSGDPRTR